MSYAFYVKSSSDISSELLEKYQIPNKPIVFRGKESTDRYKVATHFMNALVSVGLKIEQLLRTNIPIKMTDGNENNHNQIVEKGYCPICKCKFVDSKVSVKDNNHLNCNYRQIICNNCNLKRKTPKFVPCYFHNLSNYDSHFIVTQLGYDDNATSIIPSLEEKFISFTKHISKKISILFLDTMRFMWWTRWRTLNVSEKWIPPISLWIIHVTRTSGK